MLEDYQQYHTRPTNGSLIQNSNRMDNELERLIAEKFNQRYNQKKGTNNIKVVNDQLLSLPL